MMISPRRIFPRYAIMILPSFGFLAFPSYRFWCWLAAIVMLQAGALTGFSQAPTITSRPLSQLITVGQTAIFTVTASGTGPLTYQWRRNGQNIAGATAPFYSVSNATMADRGYYEVLVSNASDTATSVCHLHVAAPSTGSTLVLPWGAEPSGPGTVITPPPNLYNLVSVAAGETHAVALKADGTVVAWGSNTYGATTVPAGLQDVVAVSASRYQSLALKGDGTVVSWGNHFSSTLLVPFVLQQVVAISSRGGHLALTSDGTVVAWGTEAAPAGLSGVRSIAAGGVHNLALKSDGTVVAWGPGSSDNPQVVPSGLANIVAIGAGDHHSLAIRADGTVAAWGRNDVGQATPPAGLNNVVAVAGGFVHSIALRADGSVVGWGRDNEGQVSGATRLGAIVGISAGSYFNLGLAKLASPAFSEHPSSRTANIGDNVTFSVKTTGAPLPSLQWRKNNVNIPGATGVTLTLTNVQTTNSDNYSVVATSEVGSATSNAAILTVVPPPVVTSRSLSRNVSVGQPVSFSITATGIVSYQWKRNGQPIAGATTNTFAVASATLADRGYYEVIATDANGGIARGVSYLNVAATPNSLVTWGMGTTPDSYPWNYPPASLTDVIAIGTGGGYYAALRTNGTVTLWGNFAPPLPANLTDVVAIAPGGNHLLALKSNGTVVVAGTGGYSEQNVPAGATDIVAISASGYNSMALRADGTVLRWGYDFYGNLTTPTGLNDVVAIAAGNHHSLALKSDGSVVAWGNNSRGQATVSPVLTGAVAVAASQDQSMVLRSDGAVSVWGDISAPPEGLGTVRAIASGHGHATVQRSDGGIVSWGRNDYTQSTVPIGLSAVNAISAGGAGNLALLGIPAAPAAISTQPASRTVVYGQTATFSVVGSGTPQLSYQWYKNGNPVYDTGSFAGTRTPTLSVSNAQNSDAGSYTVVVSNGYGNVTSSAATLTVVVSAVTAQAAPIVGGSVTLGVSGPQPTGYQWRFRGAPINGATSATLTLSGLTRAQNGSYDVLLNFGGTSSPAHAYTLDVRPAVMPDLLQPDLAFEPRFEDEGAGTIFTVIRLTDGKFLVGGDFTRLGATRLLYLARLHANGSLDTSFVPPVLSGPVQALLLQADGKICVAGEFAFVNGVRRGGLLRLNADLTLDSGFATGDGFDAPVHALAQQSDGRLLVGGEFFRYESGTPNRIARLNADGTMDSTFRYINTLPPVRVIRIGQDGKVMIGGGVFGDNSTSPSGFARRLLGNGDVDLTWILNGFTSSNPNGPVLALHQLSDGRWMMAGAFYGGNYGGPRLVRLTADGAADASFTLDSSLVNVGSIRFVTDAGAGRLLISGDGLSLARLLPAGALDHNLYGFPFANADIRGTTSETGGALRLWGGFAFTTRVAGSVTLPPEGGFLGVPQGEIPRGLAAVFDAQPVTGNRFLIRGGFTHVNDLPRRGLVRMNEDGTVDSTFTPGTTLSLAHTGRFAVQGDGRVLVHTGTALVRLQADGALDSSYSSAAYTAGTVVLDNDGLALVANGATGGIFGSGMGVRRLSTTGAVATDFSVTVTGSVYDAVVQSSGRILLSGQFGSVNGTSAGSLVRVLPNGAVDPGFPIPSSGGGNRLYPASDDRTYLLSGSRVRRLDSAGSDNTFDYYSQPDAIAVLPLPDGKLLRSSEPSADPAYNASWFLGRHLSTGALDTAFQTNGLNQRRTRIERMMLTDDGSVWVFGKNLTAFGVPRLGAIRLAAAAPVSLTTAPVAAQASPGGSVTVSVVASGTAPLTSQWYRDGVKIAGATESSRTISNLSLADVAAYTVKVSNAFSSVTSPPVSISGLNPAPTITTQPVSQTGIVGNPITLSVSATATGSLAYQWRRQGHAMPGATTSTLLISDPTRADAGLYDVVVADGLSVRVSQGARVLVAPSSFPNTLQPDSTFLARFEAAGGTVNAIVPAPGGKFIVTGDFTRLNGVECPGIARVDENLQVDSTFTPPAFLADQSNTFSQIGFTRVHAVLDDGKLLVTHALPAVGDYPHRNRLVRLLANGMVDPTFTASTEPPNVYRLAVQPDGRVIVIGLQISTPLPTGKGYVYRLNSDGALDSSYAPVFRSGSSAVPPSAVVVQPDGRAIFTGGYTSVNGTSASGLVRLTAAGTLDPSFVVQGFSNPFPTALFALNDGRLLVGGAFNVPNVGAAGLLRLSVNGAWEATLLPASSAPVHFISRQADGKLWVVAGSPANTTQLAMISRLSPAGVIERQFNQFMYGTDWAIAPAGSDRLLITSKPDVSRAIVRLAEDGTVDGTTGSVETLAGVNAVVSGPGGKIYVAGPFTRVNGTPHPGLVRLNADGSRDGTFDVGSGFDVAPNHLTLLGDRQLLVSGQFSTYRGLAAQNIVRLQGNGSRDTGFNPDNLNGSPLYGSMTQLLDGRILVDGACLRSDGSIDPGLQGGGREIALPDGGLLIGSESLSSRLVTRKRADGTTAAVSGVSTGRLSSIALQADDKVLMGGTQIFTLSQPTQVVRYNSNLTLDSYSMNGLPLPAFTTSSYRGPQLLMQEDGRVILNDYYGVRRLQSNGAYDPSLGMNVTALTAHTEARGPRAMLFLDDGSMLVGDGVLDVDGLRRQGIGRFVDRAAAIIAVQPIDQSAVQGGSVALRVGATSPNALSFQWLKDGQPIGGATAASLNLTGVSSATTGSYSVNVTNANGTVRSGAAFVNVFPSGAPVISAQPKARYVTTGQSAAFSVLASGNAPLTYRWFKNGAVIAGATQSSFTVANVSAADAGDYSVEVTNPVASVWSNSAPLVIVPVGIVATQARTGAPASPGGIVTITNTVTYPGSATGLKWQVLLPSGWSIASSSGTSGGAVPAAGTTDLAEWSWNTPPSSPVVFSYGLNVPSALTGNHELTALVSIFSSNAVHQLLATPDPLALGLQHSADTNGDSRISLLELTRVIELYNTRNGGVRTGCYAVATSPSEDGFAPDPMRSANSVAPLAHYHSADSDRDGMISAGELTRVVELFNYRNGTVRTGQFHLQDGTVDGFAPGP